MQGIPAPLVERMWLFAEPYIRRALEHASGELTADDLKKFCLNRDVQLWLISQENRVVGAATTEIVQYPNRKHCRVITVAGSNFSEWIEVVEGVWAAWARALGCTAMEAHVRKGLVPKLVPLGYKHKHSVVVKELSIIAPQQEYAE